MRGLRHGGEIMTSSNRYEYFNRYRKKGTVEEDHQEIEQAIDSIVPQKKDINIQWMWARLLK